MTVIIATNDSYYCGDSENPFCDYGNCDVTVNENSLGQPTPESDG